MFHWLRGLLERNSRADAAQAEAPLARKIHEELADADQAVGIM